MTRLELLNLIAQLTGAQDYLEIGVAEGNTLTKVVAPRRTGVDPAPRYYAMDAERLAAIQALELHESESDHFFAHNTRTFDLIFVDGLHIYEQAMKDILNALDVLNPGGFVLVHDLVPLEPEHAARNRTTELWNGDVWKVVFDLWRHHKDVGYFVMDDDAGVGVLWKKREGARFTPGWHEYIRDFGYEVMDKAGPQFLNKVAPDAELIRGLVRQVLAEKAQDIHAQAGLRFGRRSLGSAQEFEQALDSPQRQDCCWSIEEERYQRPDPERLVSNFPLDLYRKTVCANTGGNILRPEKRVYLLHDALLTPCVKHKGKWPFLWNIQDSKGESMRDLLQRRDGPAPTPASGAPITELPGLHVYLGWFAPFYGHFLSEVLPQLWIARHLHDRKPRFLLHIDPGCAEQWRQRTDEMAQFVRTVFEHFGVDFKQVTFIEGPVRVERLVASTPINRYQRGARPELFEMAREVREVLGAGQPAPGGQRSQRIYLSRSRFNGRRFVNGEQIEALFARRGFRVVHPETLPLAEQIALASQAQVIAGEEGSALCNAFFANKPLVIDLESGRFHPNLAKLSYVNARQYVYLPPYPSLEALPPVRQNCLLYAHPWVVDQCLATMFGDSPAGETLCGPRRAADLLQQALGFSLKGEPERCIEQLLELVQAHPAHFAPEYLSYCKTNLSQCGTPEQGVESFAQLGVKLLRAWRAGMAASARGAGASPAQAASVAQA